MTLSNTKNRWDYIGNGTAGPYVFDNKILSTSHLQVYVDGVLKTLNTHYTVTGIGSPTGGNVTFTAGNYPPNGSKVLLLRVVSLDQLSDYVNHDPLNAETLENDLDKIVMMAQQISETTNRALRVSVSSLANCEIPEGPNKFLKWNALGTGFEAENVVPFGQDLSDYVKLTGRVGGQTIYGGTGSGENLTLHSTSHATKGKVGVADLNFYINSDYVSGDEDATLDFNNGMASIKLEYLSSAGIRQFFINERVNINEIVNGVEGFQTSDNTSFGLRVGAIYDVPTWSQAGRRAGNAIYAQVENKFNESDPSKIELCGASVQMYALTNASKAPMYGVDIFLLKQNPCVTPSWMVGCDVIITSDVTPIADFDGIAFRASSQTLDGYSAVRQNIAFYSGGNMGWKYPFLAYDTDNTTPLFYVDHTGVVYCADHYRNRHASPGIWLDETGSGNKGAYVVLDNKTLQVQRRSQGFGAYEGQLVTINLDAPDGSLVIAANGDLSTAGNMSVASGRVYRVGGTQVLGARQTGWGAPTGTATRSTFSTETVTLIELARRVKALIDDLTTHGLIGA